MKARDLLARWEERKRDLRSKESMLKDRGAIRDAIECDVVWDEINLCQNELKAALAEDAQELQRLRAEKRWLAEQMISSPCMCCKPLELCQQNNEYARCTECWQQAAEQAVKGQATQTDPQSSS